MTRQEPKGPCGPILFFRETPVVFQRVAAARSAAGARKAMFRAVREQFRGGLRHCGSHTLNSRRFQQQCGGIDVAISIAVMRSVATLLVALMFAGGPVARGVCAVWCHAMLPVAVHNCHEGTGEPAAATLDVASVACSSLLGEALAVRDDAPPIAPASTVVGWFHTPEPVLEGARLPYGSLHFARLDANAAAPLVLRI